MVWCVSIINAKKSRFSKSLIFKWLRMGTPERLWHCICQCTYLGPSVFVQNPACWAIRPVQVRSQKMHVLTSGNSYFKFWQKLVCFLTQRGRNSATQIFLPPSTCHHFIQCLYFRRKINKNLNFIFFRPRIPRSSSILKTTSSQRWRRTRQTLLPGFGASSRWPRPPTWPASVSRNLSWPTPPNSFFAKTASTSSSSVPFCHVMSCLVLCAFDRFERRENKI